MYVATWEELPVVWTRPLSAQRSTRNDMKLGLTMFYSYRLFVTACVFVLIANRENAFACIVIPICFLICLFVPFVTMLNHMPAAHFISIGELGIEIALFSIAVVSADFFFIDALKTYALCRVVHVLLNSLGWYAASFSSFTMNDLMNSQASLAAVFIGIEVISVCLIVAIVKAQKSTPDLAKYSDVGVLAENEEEKSVPTDAVLSKSRSKEQAGENAEPRATEAETMESLCRVLGGRYGLSSREVDVFMLLAKGYSSARIQEELYIAPGTVNYHTRNIYAKLNVHSKQELISLVSNSM